MNNVCKFILVIFVSIILASLFMIPRVEAAVYIIDNGGKAARVGEEAEFKIGIDTENERLNLFSVQMELSKGLEFVMFDKRDSVVNVWVKEPTFDPETRAISFDGGVPGGFVGRLALIGVVVKPVKPGAYSLAVNPNSEAYLNDGLGTRAELSFQGMDLNVGSAVSTRTLPIWAWVLIVAVILSVAIWIIRKKHD